MLHAYMLSDMKIKPLNDRVVIEPMAAEEVKKFNIEPVIAMVSYSNFGSVKSSEHTRTLDRVRKTIACFATDGGQRTARAGQGDFRWSR